MSSNESLKALPFMEIPETDGSSADVIELQEYRDGQKSETEKVEIALNADFYKVEAARSDPTAFAELIKQYSGLIWFLTNRYYLKGATSEDLMQEAMLGFYKGVRDFDGVSSSFNNFVTLCIRRQIYSALKTANREKHKPLNNSVSINAPANEINNDLSMTGDLIPALESILPDTSRLPEDIVVGKEEFEGLFDAITNDLSYLECSVIKMLIVGKSYREMAVETGTDEKSIDNALQRARRKISAYLKEQE